MTRDRRRLLWAIVAAVVIVAGGWLLRGWTEPADESAAVPPPPSAPPDGFRWVGSGHVVVGIPEEWAVDDAGCETPPCNSSGGEGERRSTVSIAFTAEDEVSPQDESVTIDGTAALRSPVACDDTGCTGRILVPTEQALVVVKGATEDEVAGLLDGVHVLDDLVAVPETRFSEQPSSSDALRFAEWAESLDLDVELRPVAGDVAGQVIEVEPPTGTMVEPGTTVVADVVRPLPDDPDCTTLALFVRTDEGREQLYPPVETVRLQLGVGDLFRYDVEGSCRSIIKPDRPPQTVTRKPGGLVVTWFIPECTTLVPEVAATCAAGQARLASVVVEVGRDQ